MTLIELNLIAINKIYLVIVVNCLLVAEARCVWVSGGVYATRTSTLYINAYCQHIYYANCIKVVACIS